MDQSNLSQSVSFSFCTSEIETWQKNFSSPNLLSIKPKPYPQILYKILNWHVIFTFSCSWLKASFLQGYCLQNPFAGWKTCKDQSCPWTEWFHQGKVPLQLIKTYTLEPGKQLRVSIEWWLHSKWQVWGCSHAAMNTDSFWSAWTVG